MFGSCCINCLFIVIWVLASCSSYEIDQRPSQSGQTTQEPYPEGGISSAGAPQSSPSEEEKSFEDENIDSIEPEDAGQIETIMRTASRPEGRWLSDCYALPSTNSLYNLAQASYQRKQVELPEGSIQWIFSTQYFSDSTCTDLRFTIKETTDYVYEEEIADNPGHFTLETKVVSYLLITHVSEATSCFGAWTADNHLDISGKICGNIIFPILNQSRYDIYQIQAEKIFFGNQPGYADLANRPDTFEEMGRAKQQD